MPTRIDWHTEPPNHGDATTVKTPCDEPNDIKIAHILSLLENLPLDTIQTIEQVTPHQLEPLWQALQGKRGRESFNAKFLYLDKEKKLIVMNPSSAHEGFVELLSHIANTFLDTLDYDKRMFKFIVTRNKGLYYTDENGIERQTQPDFQVLILNNYSRMLTPKWIGEVCFTADPLDTRNHLRDVVAYQPHIDLAFMITIKEGKWMSPRREDERLDQLRSQPLLTQMEFTSDVGDNLGSVVKGGFAWISIQEISFELYTRPPSGSLVIGNAGQDEHSAYGILYPTVNMLDIDLLFLDGSNNLRDSLILEMEGTDTPAASINRMRQFPANLIIDWDDVLMSYTTVVFMAAYERYREWRKSIESE